MADNRQLVLIVEDSRSSAQLLAQLLSGLCATALVADGQSALKYLREHPLPDLILLDIVMPGIDGYEVCRLLKSDAATYDIPIIFITGNDNAEAEEKGLALGAIDYITKPFHPATVLMRLRNHLELKRRGDLLAQLAHIDPLTGLANRRRFDVQLDMEWRRCLRQQASLTVIYFDVDHFKLFNDHYGHPEGDVCLRKIAQALSSAMHRGGDLIARYGGEEFVALLPETDVDGARAVAQVCLSAVRQLAIGHATSATAEIVTVSIGALALRPNETTAPAQLLDGADHNLYRAKQTGRNRFVVS